MAGTKVDEAFIGSCMTNIGHFGAAGARTEMPGCSLCMGNQAQVREGATVVSTSTCNFPDRLGKNSNLFLASAELAAIFKYLNFDQIEAYVENAKEVTACEGGCWNAKSPRRTPWAFGLSCPERVSAF